MNKGLKSALIIAAMLSVGAGAGYTAIPENTIDDGRTVTVTSDVSGMSSTSGKNGGAYAVSNGTLNINAGITFDSNYTTASQSGGALWFNNATAYGSIGDNVTFSNNNAKNNGGAIYLYTRNATNVTFGNNILFDSNTATTNGGAIYVYQAGTGIVLNNTTFTGNTATGLGGAIYSHASNSTITTADNSTLEFTGNSANKGGAIYNKGTLSMGSGSTATFKGNQATGADNFGGAIYNDGSIVNLVGTFGGTGAGEGNSASYGGAIYNNTGKTITSINADFMSNSASGHGGAIYNAGTITIKTNDTSDITFSGNTDSSGSNAIHNEGGTVNFDGTKSIIFNDSLTDNGGVWNKNGVGTLVLANDMSGVSGTVNINAGTVKLAQNALDSGVYGTFFSNAAKTTFASGTILDAQNNHIDEIDFGDELELAGNITANIDIDFTKDTEAGRIDHFTAGSLSSSNAGNIVINAINMKVIGDSSDTTITTQIADTTLAGIMSLPTDSKITIDGSTSSWILSYNNTTGILTFQSGMSLKDAIASTAATTIFNATENEDLTEDLGTLNGGTTTVDMQNKYVDAREIPDPMEPETYTDHSGIVLTGTDTQTLSIKNSEFRHFINNTGSGNGSALIFTNDATNKTVNLTDVDFKNNTAVTNGGAFGVNTNTTLSVIANVTANTRDVIFSGNEAKGGSGGGAVENNKGTLNIAGTNDHLVKFINNTASGSSAYGGAINLRGNSKTSIQNAYFEGNQTTNGSGGAIALGGSTTNLTTLVADFYNNTAKSDGGAIWNNGVIGDTSDLSKTAISGNFTKNKSTNGSGGAIFNTNVVGRITNITGNFGSATDSNLGNSANDRGGAIFNANVINSINANFYNNHSNSLGGAIYNDSTAEITSISGNFVGNTTNDSGYCFGGAIANNGVIGDTTDIDETAISGNFTSNTAGVGGAIFNDWAGTITKITGIFGSSTDSTKGNIALDYAGGAIYNEGTINTIEAKFYNNKVLDGDGGAIDNENTIDTITGSFYGNLAAGSGGAIFNYGELTIKTNDTENIVFQGNYDNVTFDGTNFVSGTSNAIHNYEDGNGATVTFDGKKDIIFNDRLTDVCDGDYATWIKNGTGGLVLAEDMTGVHGNVQINGGTVKLAQNSLNEDIHGTFFSNANSTTFGTGTTTKLDAQNNNNIDRINLGKNVTLDGNINAYIDVDLSGTSDVADKIVAWDDVNDVAGTITGDGKIYINTINLGILKNIRLTSDVDAPTDATTISRTIAGENIASYLVVATDVRVGLENSSEKWILSYDGDSGVLTFNNGWTLPEAIASTEDSVIYNAIIDEPTLTADLGDLGGVTTSVRMNGKTVNGGGHGGVNVATTGQELGIQNATFTNFSKTGNGGVINNLNGTVTLTGFTASNNSATGNGGAIMNDTNGAITISGSEFSGNEAGYDGGAIYNGGSTFTISGTSSIHDNVANGNGGGIYVINQATNISGTTFTSNTAKKRGGTVGGDGGAYYAMNSTTTMNNVTFTSNSSESTAGAFANAGGTATLTNASFISNTASGMAGALYNAGGTTTVNKGTFTSNSSAGAFGGGAIFNDGDNSKVEIKSTGNSFTSNFATQGGAISNFGKQIDVSKATFSGNKAISNSQGGGAILNNGEYRVGTVNITDSSFTNNLAANQGGAISNIGNATNSIVNITASGTDITFSGNKQGIVFNPDGTINDDSGAVSNAIYNEGTVVFAGSKTITLSDSITGTVNSNYTKNGTGTLVLANDMSGVLGDVILNRGTVKIASGGNFFSNDTTRAKKVEVAGGGVLLDVKNGSIETVDLGNLVLTKDLNIAVDVDLSKTGTAAIDNFKTTGEITGTKNIIIDTIDANNIIYMHAINDLAASAYPKTSASGDSTEYEARRVVTQIADASIADKFKLANHISLDTREVIDGSTNNHDSAGNTGLGWFMYYNSTTGELNFIDQSLRATLKDTSDDTKIYIMAADEVVENHLNEILGTAGDTSTNTTVQISGQNHEIDGNGFKGVIVESGQKFIVENVSEASGFAKSSDNGAFINVKAGGEADIIDSTIKNNSVNNAQGGAVYLNAGNLVLDGATFDSNSATKTGTSGGSGGAIYNYKGTISEATGASQSVFTSNTAAVNGGAIGNVGNSNTEKSTIESLNAQFTNNTAASNGGAIYNRIGDINSLSGTFTSNTADNGGAIYNYSGTINLSNATFDDNGATTAGGAINNATSTAIINMSDVTFNAPTGSNANDVYNIGTINVSGGTNTFASDITNTGNITFGGTNTISAAINTTATGSNKIAFTGTNELTSTVTMSGDMALTNSGDLTLNNDLSAYTGNYTQTAGSTDVKSTATLFGGTNKVQGGTMALDGTLASSLDVQGGNVTSTGTYAAGSTTAVNGGTLTMNGGTMASGSTIRVYSGTMNYQAGNVNGDLKVKGGNLNVQNNLTIQGDSYIREDAVTTIDSGKTLAVQNLNPANTTGVQLNSNDNWNGNVNVGANGILSVIDIVNGDFTQTAGVSNFNNATLDMTKANISAGDVNLESSTMNYVAGTTFTPDNLNLSGGSLINMMNSNAGETLTLNNVQSVGTNNISLDINPMAGQFDTIVINGDLTGTGALKVDNFNCMGAMPTEANYKFQLFDVNGSISNVDFLSSDKEFQTAIGTYRMMSNGGGSYTFGITGYNPQTYRGQIASMSSYSNQILIDNIVLDQFILQNNVLPTAKTANRYASAQSMFAPYQHTPEEGGLWYKSYVDFEKLTFTHGVDTRNTAYGSLIGADFPLVHLKHGWDFIPTFYVGYNGARQDFSNTTMYQNGGQGGFMGTFIHKDFVGSIMAYGGGYHNEMNVGGERDSTGNWFAGSAAKLAYNFHPTKHFIIEPTAFISYNIFGKQHWHSDYGAVGMNSGLLNGINVAPGLNLIYKRETWSAYATFQYMFNINDNVSGRAANIDVPSIRMRHGYFQYGIGVTKTWKDRLHSYLQIALRNGGRTGVGFQLGVKYSFDWKLSPKSKTNNAAPKKSTAQKHVLKG